MLFQRVAALLVELPGRAQRLQAGLVAGDHLGHAVEAGKEGGRAEVQVDQQVVVVARVLSPADEDRLAGRLADQRVGQEGIGAELPQQLVKTACLRLVGAVQENPVTPAGGLVGEPAGDQRPPAGDRRETSRAAS